MSKKDKGKNIQTVWKQAILKTILKTMLVMIILTTNVKYKKKMVSFSVWVGLATEMLIERILTAKSEQDFCPVCMDDN